MHESLHVDHNDRLNYAWNQGTVKGAMEPERASTHGAERMTSYR